MNKIVNFVVAKLLKEKGFDSYTPLKYFSKKPSGYNIINWSENTPYNCEDIYSQLSLGYDKQTYFIWAPTIADVIMWLYEKHGIWIQVCISRYGNFYCNILKKENTKSLDNPISWEMQYQLNDFNSPTEAYEAAIEYCLIKLLKN